MSLIDAHTNDVLGTSPGACDIHPPRQVRKSGSMEAFCSDGNVPEQQKDYGRRASDAYAMFTLSRAMFVFLHTVKTLHNSTRDWKRIILRRYTTV